MNILQWCGSLLRMQLFTIPLIDGSESHDPFVGFQPGLANSRPQKVLILLKQDVVSPYF